MSGRWIRTEDDLRIVETPDGGAMIARDDEYLGRLTSSDVEELGLFDKEEKQ